MGVNFISTGATNRVITLVMLFGSALGIGCRCDVHFVPWRLNFANVWEMLPVLVCLGVMGWKTGGKQISLNFCIAESFR